MRPDAEQTAFIYLDYAATTPVDPAVAATMQRFLTARGLFANPAAGAHAAGRAAARALEQARAQVAVAVGAEPEEIIFTSGATEADNLAILGAARFNTHRGRHLVTSRTEHRAVLEPCRALRRDGWTLTELEPGADGRVDPAAVEEALRDDTVLVSVMHVNNETGAVNDVAAIGAICRARGTLLHVDAAQSVGKLAVDVRAMQADLLSISGHKIYGPKGAGALFVRARPPVGLAPLMFGGGQERDLRPGTVATHQAAGLGEALRLAAERREADFAQAAALRRRLLDGLADFPGWRVNQSDAANSPYILSLSFAGVEGESLLFALRELAVSAGAACGSDAAEPSYVLRSLGLDEQLAQATLRLSFGRPTTEGDIDATLALIRTRIPSLRRLAPPEALVAGH